MTTSNLMQALAGWGSGYQFGRSQVREDEIRQGGNHYASPFIHFENLNNIGFIATKLTEHIPSPQIAKTIRIFSKVGPWLAIPGLIFIAVVKQGSYNQAAAYLNANILPASIQLPTELGQRTITIATFFVDHLGNIARVCMIAGGVALICLKQYYFGVPFFLGIGYEALDSYGYVPRKISLFMEKYSPLISFIGLACTGNAINAVLWGSTSLLTIFPEYNRILQQKVDRIAQYCFGWEGPRLEEIEAPLVQNRELSYDEINAILHCQEQPQSFTNRIIAPDYEINPAHCSKASAQMLAHDRNFDGFTTHFDSINWNREYGLVSRKLKDDDRFIQMLAERFNQTDHALLRRDFENYMERIAEQDILEDPPRGITKKAIFATRYLRNQNATLIRVLKGEERVRGQQRDLEIAINNASQILAHINQLPTGTGSNQVEKIDILLKLSVEAGSYCGRGIRRATEEIVEGLRANNSVTTNVSANDLYETTFYENLYSLRRRISQNCMNEIMATIRNGGVPEETTHDVHFHDVYRRQLGLGFIPLYAYERDSLSLLEIMIWKSIYGNIINLEYDRYNPEEIFQEMGELPFFNYMRGLIEANPNLTREQKDEIIEKYSENNTVNEVAQWQPEETQRRFHRLAFVMLGVLRRSEANNNAPSTLTPERVRQIA